MEIFRLLSQYFYWRVNARNLHGIHSPFVYRFNDECINCDEENIFFKEIESLRKKYQKDNRELVYTDPGAGARGSVTTGKQTRRKVSTIAYGSLQKPRFCRLLWRTAHYYGAKNVLELGTSLGITTSYLAIANPDIQVDTIEGSLPVADVARETFNTLNLTNITLHRGTFDQVLPGLLGDKTYDMVYIDGDHKGESLLRYFDIIIKQIPASGVIILDDIRWSGSMYKAWLEIQQHPRVRVTVDLFTMGVIFLNENLSREHFMIKF